ncbi:MAG: S8/S53 family peptidase [Oligoflexales bacterium]|nr:S8/S53 family peptidase [Oligoflexales bacterium]
MRFVLASLITLLTFSLVGCGELFGKKKSNSSTPPALTMIEKSDVTSYLTKSRNDEATTVMVIDNNFDYEHEVFKDKIVAAYTIVCEEDSTSMNSDEFYREFKKIPFEVLKTTLIEDYKNSDQSCRIEQGIKFRYIKEDFDAIASFRDDWNDFMLGRSNSMSQNTLTLTTTTLDRLEPGYHGTNTAGLIARDNDKVNLVLVHMDLDSSEGAIEDKLDCKTADIISTLNKLLADEEVKQAAIDQPPSSEEQGLNQIIDQHNVRIVNKSFGPLTSSTLDSFFEKKGCGDSIMSTNFRLNGQIDSKREAKLRMDLPEDSRAKTVLTLESSGNEGEEINSYSDSLKCPDSTDKNTILVGSSNYSYYSSNNRSFFSNHGKCVKYHVLGHEVKVPTGLGFYNVVSGTSFSAPLLARYITLNIDGNSSNEEMIAFLDSKADKDGFIERDEDMTELSWNHRVQTDRPIIATSQRASNLLNIKRINKFAKMPNLGR